MLVWMNEEPMVPGKQYLFKQTTKVTAGTINTLRYRVDVNTLHRIDAPTLGLNEIGRVQITLNEPICFDAYRSNRGTGAFIVIDRISNVTVGAGMMLDRATADTLAATGKTSQPVRHCIPSASNVTLDQRRARFGQKPATVLLTGLAGAGKTTIAYALERKLFDMGRAVTVLDGQNMRLGISRDLGFTAEDRSENLRRSAEVAKLMNDAGLICHLRLCRPERRSPSKSGRGGRRRPFPRGASIRARRGLPPARQRGPVRRRRRRRDRQLPRRFISVRSARVTGVGLANARN